MRLHLTRRSDLGIRLLRALADGQRHTAADLARAAGTSAGYIPQVMGFFVRAGWVFSGAGPNGGYELATPLHEVSLLDVIELLEGPLEDGRCVLWESECSALDPCLMHDAWTAARATLREHLERSVISPLSANGAGGTPSGLAGVSAEPRDGGTGT